jgi:hypothetical protein
MDVLLTLSPPTNVYMLLKLWWSPMDCFFRASQPPPTCRRHIFCAVSAQARKSHLSILDMCSLSHLLFSWILIVCPLLTCSHRVGLGRKGKEMLTHQQSLKDALSNKTFLHSIPYCTFRILEKSILSHTYLKLLYLCTNSVQTSR